MSIAIMIRIWASSALGGTELLLLLAIADFANDNGVAFPSVGTLAKKIRMSERNVRYLLTKLVESGELIIERNKGPKGCNLFRVQTLQGANLSGVKPVAAGGEVDGRQGVKPTSPEPSVNHHEPSEVAQALLAPATTKKSKRTDTTLKTFIEQCQAVGEKPIPADDPVFAYAEKVGISEEMLAVAWAEFKAFWLPTRKLKKDWPGTFRGAVRQNRARLWYLKEGEPAHWTSTGEQARRAAA